MAHIPKWRKASTINASDQTFSWSRALFILSIQTEISQFANFICLFVPIYVNISNNLENMTNKHKILALIKKYFHLSSCNSFLVLSIFYIKYLKGSEWFLETHVNCSGEILDIRVFQLKTKYHIRGIDEWSSFRVNFINIKRYVILIMLSAAVVTNKWIQII